MNRVTWSKFWEALPWDIYNRKVFRLQCKIYEAKRYSDYLKVRKLQKLLLHSSFAHYLAIYYSVWIKTRRPYNISYQLSWPAPERVLGILERLSKKGITVKISEIVDSEDSKFYYLVIQYLLKMVLEPVSEGLFLVNSYGFRPGKTAWDLQRDLIVFFQENSNSKKKFLKLNLVGAFYKLNTVLLLNLLDLPINYKKLILRAIEIGFIDLTLKSKGLESFILAPMLVNLFFNDFHKIFPSITIFRYGTDILCILDHTIDMYNFIEKLSQFFYKCGFLLSPDRVHVAGNSYDFNFLGWQFKVKFDHRVFTYPSEESWLQYKKKIKSCLIIPNSKLDIRIEKTINITKEWYFYNRFCRVTQFNSKIYYLKSWYSNFLIKRSTIKKSLRLEKLRKVFVRPVFFRILKTDNFSSLYDINVEEWNTSFLLNNVDSS